MTERFYIVVAGLAALSLLAMLATAIVCIYFDRGMRVQARGRTQEGTSIEAELEVNGTADRAPQRIGPQQHQTQK